MDVKKFYNVLSKILSNKFGANVEITVIKKTY